MTLTAAQQVYVMLRDAGPEGVHSHTIRVTGTSGNPSERCREIVGHGVPVYTARENVGKRPGSRYWLSPHQPDWAIAVKGNGVEVGGGHGPKSQEQRGTTGAGSAPTPPPAADLSADTLCWYRNYDEPDNDWALVPFAEVMAA